jgi:pimeloyl-ACP methyl ester carboxylesterase
VTTFVLIHGGGDVGWSWHLVEAELLARGHRVVAPDLPGGDDSLDLFDYADSVIAEVGEDPDVIVVGHSFGGFTAPIVATKLSARSLVFVAGMIPAPGEPPESWWENTGYKEASQVQAKRDGGLTGNDDPSITFYHDVPRALAKQALSRERAHPSSTSMSKPWPLKALPQIPTHFVLCTEDRMFPADFMRQVAAKRLGIVPDEIRAGHCVALSRPRELADLLVSY